MSSAVIKGVLTRVSPSLIETFNPESPFGCPVKGFLKYVTGLKEPQTGNQALGTELHALNEGALKSERQAGSDQAIALFRAGEHFVTALTPRVIGVERSVPGTIAGVKISEMSKCDVVTNEPGVVDWKTTSSLEYAKTPGQLRRNDQLIIYARAFHPDAEEVTLTHGYYVTKGRPYFEARSVKITKQQIENHYDNVLTPAVEDIKRIVALPDTTSLTPNTKACFRCGLRSQCPAQNQESSNAMASFFEKFKATSAVSVLDGGIQGAKPPEAPGEPELRSGPAILPPDAPKSDPALAAEPVEGWLTNPQVIDTSGVKMGDPIVTELVAKLAAEAAPTPPVVMMQIDRPEGARQPYETSPGVNPYVETSPKRGRGRPPGAKNRPKGLDSAVAIEHAMSIDPQPPAPVAARMAAFATQVDLSARTKAPQRVTEVTASFGLTYGLPGYSSIRVDLSDKATVHPGEDPAVIRDELLKDLKARVIAQVEEVKALMSKGAK